MLGVRTRFSAHSRSHRHTQLATQACLSSLGSRHFSWIMNPLVRKAKADYEQKKDGSYAKIFPRGANNISSVFKKVGEDFFEEGSSEYAGNIDTKDDKGAFGVWNTDSKRLLGAAINADSKKCD